ELDGVWIEPLACILRAAESVPSGRVLVVGCGAIGQLWVQVLRRRGEEVVAVDPRDDRLAVAHMLGADQGAGPVDAAGLYAPGDLRIEVVPKPEPGPGEVLVQVEVALTDGTDLKTFRRGHPLLLRESPAPFGHEFCGIVDGRRVVAANSAPCGRCDG